MQLQRLTLTVAVAALLALGFSAVAQAQPYGGGRPHGPPAHAYKPHHGPKYGHQHPGWHHGPRPGPHMHHGHRPPPVAHYYRGAGPQHRWVQGSRIPPQYRGPRYVVNDWRGHRLHQPPRGYHWVRYGGDYMLVAIASGVITQLLLHGAR